MSFPFLWKPFLTEQQQHNIRKENEAFSNTKETSEASEARRKQIIEKYKKIIDDKEIQRLTFENFKQFNNWFVENILNVQRTDEYDSDDPRIRPLEIAIRIRYYHKLEEKNIVLNYLAKLDKKTLPKDIQKMNPVDLGELKQKLQDDGYNMDDTFIKSLFRPPQGGSRRKQSKRRMRKTQHRRKKNNRKSKKSKRV
jgi:hypothetical protein